MTVDRLERNAAGLSGLAHADANEQEIRPSWSRWVTFEDRSFHLATWETHKASNGNSFSIRSSDYLVHGFMDGSSRDANDRVRTEERGTR